MKMLSAISFELARKLQQKTLAIAIYNKRVFKYEYQIIYPLNQNPGRSILIVPQYMALLCLLFFNKKIGDKEAEAKI